MVGCGVFQRGAGVEGLWDLDLGDLDIGRR